MAKKNKEKEPQAERTRAQNLWSQGEELLLAKSFIQISEDPKIGSDKKNDTFWYKVLDVYNEEAKKDNYPPRTKNMLTGKWTPMNRDVQKFNSLVQETLVMSGENDEDWMRRDKHTWKNPESPLARRNRLWVTNEESEHFLEDALPRLPGAHRIAKSQRSSNSTASSGSNPSMFQEMMQQQYELDRKAKIEMRRYENYCKWKGYDQNKNKNSHHGFPVSGFLSRETGLQDIHSSYNDLQEEREINDKKEQMGYEMNAPGKSVDSFEEGEIIGELDDRCVKDCMGKKLDDE
ncbi:hypothetical protein Tco_0195587 [Tanacetum coccineum]